MYSTSAATCPDRKKNTKMEHIIIETDNNRTIDIRPGDTAHITLPENATTGYRWAIDHYDEEIINLLDSEPHYTAGGVGSGGNIDFVFQGKKAGTGEIRLKNWRSWEGESSVITRFRILLHVL